MKSYQVVRTDRRYNGHSSFKWIVMPKFDPTNTTNWHTQSRVQFQDWRNWCWTTWGPGMERDWATTIIRSGQIADAQWAWDTEHKNKRLYLKGDAEMTLFELKF